MGRPKYPGGGNSIPPPPSITKQGLSGTVWILLYGPGGPSRILGRLSIWAGASGGGSMGSGAEVPTFGILAAVGLAVFRATPF